MQPTDASFPGIHGRIRVAFAATLAAAVLVGAPRVSASDESSTGSGPARVGAGPNIYVTGGFGGAIGVGPMGFGTIGFDSGRFLFLLRASSASSFELFGPPEVSMQEQSMLVGGVFRNGNVRSYIGVGLGLADIALRGDRISPEDSWLVEYEMKHHETINVPVQAGFSIDGSAFGGGFAVVGNLNSVQSYLGFALTLSLGKLR